MSDKTTEDTLNQQEAEHAIKNYSRVPNMLVDGYNELHPQDKWLWVCLVRLCGKDRTRFLSLRYISKRTGFSPSVLSDDKKNGKPGMIRRLHNAGVIHAEIKRKKLADGSEIGNEQYHITITDTWALNFDFYNKSTCSDSEQVIEGESQPVRNQNKGVLNQNRNAQNRSENEQACSDSSTNLILHSKTTDSNKITEEESILDQSQTANTSPSGDTLLQEMMKRLEAMEKRTNLLEAENQSLKAQLSTKQEELPTDNTQDNPADTQEDKQTAYSQSATQKSLLPLDEPSQQPASTKGKGGRGRKPKQVEVPELTEEEKAQLQKQIEEEKAKEEERLAKHRDIYACIVKRRTRELTGGKVAMERKYVNMLIADGFTAERTDNIHEYLATKHWRWSQLENKYNITAQTIYEEAGSVEAILNDLEYQKKQQGNSKNNQHTNNVTLIRSVNTPAQQEQIAEKTVAIQERLARMQQPKQAII